MINCGLII